MSDQVIAAIGRELARALRAFARERRDEQRKDIARLQTALCQAYNTEQEQLAETE